MIFLNNKYRPLRELGICTIIFVLVLTGIWFLSDDYSFSLLLFKVFLLFYIVLFLLPVLILYINYSNISIDIYDVKSKKIISATLVGTYQKINNHRGPFVLAYNMNFFYLKLTDAENKTYIVTSLEEYNLEKWFYKYFPEVKLNEELDGFPFIFEKK